jgi:hypothetical protein
MRNSVMLVQYKAPFRPGFAFEDVLMRLWQSWRTYDRQPRRHEEMKHVEHIVYEAMQKEDLKEKIRFVHKSPRDCLSAPRSSHESLSVAGLQKSPASSPNDPVMPRPNLQVRFHCVFPFALTVFSILHAIHIRVRKS